MKTYSTKANARRAAKSQGLDLNTLDFFELEENAWTWRVLAIDETSPEELSEQGFTEDSEAALAEEAGQFGGDQVLAEEYEPSEEAIAAELDKEFIERCGFAYCPDCGIHLENGLLHFGDIVERAGSPEKAFEQQKKEWSCMACNAEFGEDIIVGPAAEEAPKLNKSTADRPCTLVWNIADAMPGAKRKEVIEACVKAGVAYYTARTQYQQWKSLQPK